MNKRIRKKRGIYTKFKDEETWGLYYTIACFVLPRLKRFKKVNNGFPMSMLFDIKDAFQLNEDRTEIASKQWNNILDDMIWSFEQIVEDTEPSQRSNETREEYISRYKEWTDRIQHGLLLFAEHFQELWW